MFSCRKMLFMCAPVFTSIENMAHTNALFRSQLIERLPIIAKVSKEQQPGILCSLSLNSGSLILIKITI